jgi:PAS domain S-box-containing protein
LIFDPKTARPLEFNEKAHSQLGYSREEFSRLTISDIDCVESPEDVAARIAKVIKEGRNQFDTRHRTKHGEIRNINVTAQYIQIMGRSVYHCIWRDITERKRAEEALHASEQQLRAFYDLDLVGLAITSPVKGWVRVNNCLCNLLEYSEQELRGMTWAQLTYPDDFAADAEQFDRLLANKIEGYSIEKRFVSRTGKVVPTQLVVRCTRKANGEVDYVTAMVEDITERKQREDEIHRLNADLERRVNERTANLVAANKELETFSYSVAHDLRTPLRGVASITRIIEEDYAGHFDNEGKDLMRRVQDAAKKMGELIEGLLKLSRLSRTEVFMGIVDLSALAHAIAATLKAGDPLRQVSFDITPKLEVRGDKALLANLLENLLGNAWKFTAKETAARIELGVAKQDGKPVYFVRDNGAGFDMAFAANLFRPFHRLHNDSEYQGHGIGLATVQRIVQRHGGRIWADAAVGQGTTFYFTLSAMFYFTLSG